MKLNNAFEADARVFKEATSLGQNGYEVVIIAKHKAGLKEVEDYGVFVVRRIKKDNLIPLYSILRALWVERADIYHAHDLDSLPPTYVVAKLRRKKLVYDSHEYWKGFDENKINWKRRVFLALEKFMVPRADLLISVNKSIVEKISQNYRYKNQTVVLFNAPKYIKNLPKSLVKAKTKYSIIHVGAIQNGRGLDVLLEALKLLPKEYTLYMLGPDNYRGGYGNEVRKAGLSNRVKLLGVVPSTKVTSYASFADVALVLTQNLSENYYLSLPNKLFESISAGIPVVASDMFEISRLVKEEKIGEVCDINDPRDIAKNIVKVAANVNKYKESVRKAAQKYSWENQELKLIKAYKELE